MKKKKKERKTTWKICIHSEASTFMQPEVQQERNGATVRAIKFEEIIAANFPD